MQYFAILSVTQGRELHRDDDKLMMINNYFHSQYFIFVLFNQHADFFFFFLNQLDMHYGPGLVSRDARVSGGNSSKWFMV